MNLPQASIALMITEDPRIDHRGQLARTLVEACIGRGLKVPMVFFYADGVQIAAAPEALRQWRAAVDPAETELAVCSAAVERRELTSAAGRLDMSIIGLARWSQVADNATHQLTF